MVNTGKHNLHHHDPSSLHCSFQISGATALPWHDNARYWVATGQYAAARLCGLCLAFQGTQEIGSPIPTSTQFAQSASAIVTALPAFARLRTSAVEIASAAQLTL